MGSDPQPAQVIPAPAPPQGSQGGYQQTADEVAQSQLKNNPLLAAQNFDIQQQYGPQLAQSQFDIASKYGPLYKALTTQLFPQVGQLESQVTQQLGSPTWTTPQQQAAIDATKAKAATDLQTQIAQTANLGGTLYSGNTQQTAATGLAELNKGFALSDIGLQQQQQQQAMSNLALLFQLAFPNVQQPTAAQPSIGGDPNQLYNALVQNQGNFGVLGPTPGTPGWFGQFAQGFSGG